MVTLRITVLITFIVPLNYELCSCRCARAEYEIDKRCCPMCTPGNHVVWHCTDDTSTTCVPCPPLTYIDEPSGYTDCFTCTVCEADRGLRLGEVCTRSSDTVCGPLEGFYCIEKMKRSCTLAVDHSECSPGQYIKQAGTDYTDTVCVDCTGATYSNGSFSSCLPHIKCEAMGLTEINPGTHSSDSECGNPPNSVAIITLSVAVTLILILILILIKVVSVFKCKHIGKKKQSKISGIQETTKDLYEEASLADRISVELDSLEEQATVKNLNSQLSDWSSTQSLKQNQKNLEIMNGMNP